MNKNTNIMLNVCNFNDIIVHVVLSLSVNEDDGFFFLQIFIFFPSSDILNQHFIRNFFANKTVCTKSMDALCSVYN